MKTRNFLKLGLMIFALSLQGQKASVVLGDMGHAIDQYMSRTVPFGFSGALLVAKDGELLLNKGYGYADRNNKVKNTSSTIFSTGSLTKQFTAAAIMKLEMTGALNTNDKLSKYVEALPKDKEDIELRHLLTHTSGLPLALSEDDFESI